MAGNLVLITGSSGHLSFRVLRFALEYGHTVQAVVRSEAKAGMVRNNPVVQAMNKDSQLSFVILPDFQVPGAFDEAIKGVKYAIYVASPVPTKVPEGEDLEKFFVPQAVQATLGVDDFQPLSAIFATVDEVYSQEIRLPEAKGAFYHPYVAYCASKIAAFNGTEAWVEAEKPPFDTIHMHPSFIFGRDDRMENTRDFKSHVNRMVLNQALNTIDPQMTNMPNNITHVDDCARLHVLAHDPKTDGNQSFMVSTSGMDGMTWDHTLAIVEKHYPEQVRDETLPNNGRYETIIAKLDVGKTEETFGFRMASYESCIVSIMDHYSEQLKEEKEA